MGWGGLRCRRRRLLLETEVTPSQHRYLHNSFIWCLLGLCTYPLLRSRRLLVPPLRRVTFEERESNQSAFAPPLGAMPDCGHRGLTGRLRSKAKSKAEQQQQQQQQQSRGAKLHSPPVGVGLPAMAVYQPIHLSTETPSSQASQLPQESAYASRIRSAVRPPRFALLLI